MICYNCKQDIGSAATCPYCGAVVLKEPRPHHLPSGSMIAGRYRIDGVLGEGGFGITYLGRDSKLGHAIAIKEYFPQGLTHRYTDGSYEVYASSSDEDQTFIHGRERFLKEAQTLAQFTAEPGVVSVTDYVEENNTAYLIMEYLEGITLMQYIRLNGMMSADQTFTMLEPVMKTLEKIHAAGVIHRDISPDNIMWLGSGQLVLMDFGSARKFVDDRRSMSVMLKKGYAPIEQYRRSGEQGPWTDVYAMCATIYHCITGKLPVDSLDRAVEDTLQKPSAMGAAISPAQERVLMYGMAVDQRDRCQNMTELLGLLERAKNAGDEATMSADTEDLDSNATVAVDENDYVYSGYHDDYRDSRGDEHRTDPVYQKPVYSASRGSGDPYQNAGGSGAYQNARGYADPYKGNQNGKNKSSKTKLIWIPILCVVLTVLIGVLAYQLITLKSSDEDKEINSGDSSSVADGAESKEKKDEQDQTSAPVPAALQHVLTKSGTTQQQLNDKGCYQLVTVSSNGTKAEIRFYDRTGDTWTGNDTLTCSGYVGDNGVSTDIYEHCHATPKGCYPVGDAFYIGSKPETDLESFEITDGTYWVTDPDSKYYNQRVEGTGNKDWETAEKMITYEDYKRGFVVEFNTEAVYNAGSAIFFRIGSKATAGGIALSQSNVESYLRNLDSTKNPYIIIV